MVKVILPLSSFPTVTNFQGGQTDKQTIKSHPAFYRTLASLGLLPKKGRKGGGEGRRMEWKEGNKSRAATIKGQCPVEHKGEFQDDMRAGEKI